MSEPAGVITDVAQAIDAAFFKVAQRHIPDWSVTLAEAAVAPIRQLALDEADRAERERGLDLDGWVHARALREFAGRLGDAGVPDRGAAEAGL